jgi:hypothetical protein
MFEAVLLVCYLGGAPCLALQDTKGPYRFKQDCTARTKVMHKSLLAFRPLFAAQFAVPWMLGPIQVKGLCLRKEESDV